MTTNDLAAGYFRKCGDIDFIPTDEYDADDADTALGQARLATACLGRLLGQPAKQ